MWLKSDFFPVWLNEQLVVLLANGFIYRVERKQKHRHERARENNIIRERKGTCDLAVEGSPKSSTLMSPLNLTPSGKVCNHKKWCKPPTNLELLIAITSSTKGKHKINIKLTMYLPWSAKQKASHSLLHIIMAKDGGCNLRAYGLISIRLTSKFFELFNL